MRHDCRKERTAGERDRILGSARAAGLARTAEQVESEETA